MPPWSVPPGLLVPGPRQPEADAAPTRPAPEPTAPAPPQAPDQPMQPAQLAAAPAAAQPAAARPAHNQRSLRSVSRRPTTTPGRAWRCRPVGSSAHSRRPRLLAPGANPAAPHRGPRTRQAPDWNASHLDPSRRNPMSRPRRRRLASSPTPALRRSSSLTPAPRPSSPPAPMPARSPMTVPSPTVRSSTWPLARRRTPARRQFPARPRSPARPQFPARRWLLAERRLGRGTFAASRAGWLLVLTADAEAGAPGPGPDSGPARPARRPGIPVWPFR